MKKIIFFLSVTCFLGVFFLNHAQADSSSAFHISEFKNGKFEEVFSKTFPVKYATSTFSFNNLSDSLTLEINEYGDLPYSGVDSVILNACGQNINPTSAVFTKNSENILEDILKTDLNVVVTHDKPMRVSWSLPQGCSVATLSINANEYSDGLPVRFPTNGLKKKTAEYAIGSNVGNLNIDGDLSETDGTKPLYKVFWKPDTGHPDGYTYLYAKDDADYLYFAADVTADNTDDVGPDWISITIGGKEFKVTDSDQTYGKCSFGTSGRVSYKHQKCELKIPKSEIGYYTGTVPFVLQYYGTLAIAVTTLGDGSEDVTIPANTTATLTFNAYSGPGFSDATKAAIERDISDAADHTLTYSWDGTGLVLTINGNATYTTTFLTDVRSPYLESSFGSPYSYPGALMLIDSTPDGSSENPFKLYTCRQLQNIDYDLSSYYVLNSDIDCSKTNPSNEDFDNTDIWGDEKGFDPIGTVALNGGNIYSGFNYQSFTGTLDGQDHKITNLYINRGTNNNDVNGYYVGLFSTISSGAEVKNLGLEGVDITASGNEVGALAGGLSGTVTSVYSTGSVNGYGRVGGLIGVHVDANSFPNSSPLVYSWNGTKYVYTDDVGAILPKTLSGVDVASIDTKDVAPKDGKYSFKVAEEYNEIVYYDEMSLMTFDHLPGYSVVEPLNRSAGVVDLRTVSDTPTNPLLSCIDDTGVDCTDNLKAFDDKWSYTNINGAYDKKNLKKYWILDFGDLSHATDTELVLRGARDYAASAQYPGNSVRSVQVKNAQGNWVEVYNKNQVGSDGSPRLRTLNMTGKFLTNDYHIKVAFDTFNANYFAVDTSPQVPFVAHTYHPDSASLAFNGFTAIDRTYFFDHDYSKVSPLPDTIFKNQYGNFTKYGDVTPLLSSPDDHFVIMRSGDQLSVEFPYEAVPDGMERSFMLYNDVLYKHATNDNLGVLGQSANYLPYHGMTSYSLNMTPYPQTPENIEYQNTWNTRTYQGPFPDALRSGGSTIIDSYSTVDVTGVWELGGLVGSNQKEIRHSYATGNVVGNNEMGGLVGTNDGSGWIHDSFARGDVGGPDAYYYIGGLVGMNFATVERTYSTGLVTGNYAPYEHGFVGYQGGYSIVDSFWNTDTAGQGEGGGEATGKTTEQMKEVATFTSLATDGLSNPWDFVNNPNDDVATSSIWNINEGTNDGYPFLTWQDVVPGPVISNIDVTYDDSSAVVNWDTDATSTSKVLYSTHDAGYVSTDEYNLSPRVQSHSVSLEGMLLPCTTYYFKVYSAGAYSNITTSSASTFTTTGCPAGTLADEKVTGAVNTAANATTTLNITEGSKYFTVVTPENFTATSSSVVVQIKTLDKGTVLGSVGSPNSLTGVGSIVFDVKALINATTTLDSFDLPVTITYHYADSDISGLNESTLLLYHYHDGVWSALDSCSVDASANTITCTAPSFSVFALFGQHTVTASAPTPSGASSGGSTVPYGCTDIGALNYQKFVASDQSLCKYATTTPNMLPNMITVSASSSPVRFIFTRDLKKGMTGKDISELQKFLIAQNIGDAAKKLAKNGVSTYFGPLTQAALVEFQKSKSIRPSIGYFGPITRNFVNR